MTKRRGNHEGSISRLPSGTFRAQISLKGQRLSYTASTRKECQQWLKNISRQIDDELTFAITKITLKEFLNDWLLTIKSAKRHSTWSHYEQVARLHITPFIGEIKVIDLRPEHIQRLYSQLLDAKVGTYTILKVHMVLHSALRQAVRMGTIGRNPASFVQTPQQPVKEMSILDESQVSRFLVSTKSHRWEALFHLAVVTGARQMELLGLKWSDLDWVRQTLKIERQLNRPDGEGVKFSAPKTRFGRRTIALGRKTIEILHMHYERQQAERQTAGNAWQENGLIFTTGKGTPIHHCNLVRDFKKLLKDAGLPDIRFHDLRHTNASLQLNQGIPVITVSRRLGHAKASITLDIYGHLIASLQEDVADMIDELVTPIPVSARVVDT